MGVIRHSISNKFKGRIKYGTDFIGLLEQELACPTPSAFPQKKHADGIHLMGTGEYHRTGAVFDIENKIYTAKVSTVRELSNPDGGIGSCYKLALGERKSNDEIKEILSRNGVEFSENILMQYFQLHDFLRIRDYDLLSFDFEKKSDQRLYREINSPKRVAKFTVIQEEDEDYIPVHKGQRIIPKGLTETRMHFCGNSGFPYEFVDYSKEDLKKYPIVEIR